MKKNYVSFLFIIFVLSGISGLIYEIIWSRLLTSVFGSTIYAISIVISVYMAGLALGSYVFGNLIDKYSKSKLRFYSFIEFGIAITALISFLLLPIVSNIYSGSFQSVEQNILLDNIFKIISTVIILIVPTSLLGATLPIISKIVTNSEKNITRSVGFLYGLNTLGGLLGILISSFYTIENYGVRETFFIAIFINILLGIIIFFKSSSWDANIISEKKSKEKIKLMASPVSKSANRLSIIILITYCISGFSALALETLWTRSLLFFIGSSTYAFSIILVNFLIGISLGSIIITFLINRIERPVSFFAYCQILIAVLAVISLYLFRTYSIETYQITINSPDPLFLGSVKNNIFGIFIKSFYVIFPSTFIMGILFTIVNKIINTEFLSIGKNIGIIYSSNTFGTIFGSLIPTFIFIPLIGVSNSIIIISILNFSVGILVILANYISIFNKIITVSISLIVFVSLVFSINKITEFKSDTEQFGDKTLFYSEGNSATVKVYQDKEGYRSISVNGMMIGGTQLKSLRKEMMLAHLPMLIQKDPKKILTVGLGSGITLGEISLYNPDVLHCVEIVDIVKTGARYFSGSNNNVIDNTKVKIFIEDGRKFIHNSSDKYDVIIDDSMLRRESAGNGPLYADEYYADCSKHLSEDGIFCQWLPLYLERNTYQSVLKTLKSHFNDVTLWYMGHAAVIQIATNSKLKIDIDELIKRMNSEQIKSSLKTIDMDDASALLKSYLLNDEEVSKFSRTSLLNSDNNPIIEFKVPKESGSIKSFSENLLELAPKRDKSIPDCFYFSNSVQSQEIRYNLQKNWNNFHLILAGAILGYGGNSKGEIEKYLNALEIDPNDKLAKYFLEIGNGNSKERKAKAFFDIANIYSSKNNFERSIYYLNESINTDSTFVNAYNQLANIYFDLKQTDKAINYGEKAVKNNNSVTLIYNLATYYEEAKLFNKAYDLYYKVLQIDPSNINAKSGLQNCNKNIK